MNSHCRLARVLFICLVLLAGGHASAQEKTKLPPADNAPADKTPADKAPAKEEKKDFTFADVDYFHRFTEGNLHEYTPKGQDDLEKWKDMVSIVIYPKATDGEGVAGAANATLENYKAGRALVLRTASVARTEERPAEHFVAVVFPRPEFAEVVFARFKLHEGTGMGLIHSHRIYGEPKEIADEVGKWIKDNGETLEKKLMAFDAVLKLKAAPAK